MIMLATSSQYIKRRSLPWRSWCSLYQHATHDHQTGIVRPLRSDLTNELTLLSSSSKTTRTISFNTNNNAETTTAAAATENNKAAADNNNNTERSPPKTFLFPWRHEREPPPVYVYTRRRREPLPHQRIHSTFGTFTTALTMLRLPLYQLLFDRGWKDDLANAAAFAFSQSVAAVLNSAYQIKANKKKKNRNGDTTTAAGDDNDDDLLVSFDSNDDTKGKKGHLPNLDDILDNKLVQLYHTAQQKQGGDQVRIVLQMRPVSAELINLMHVPFLTRAEVAKDPSLKNKRITSFQERGTGPNVFTNFHKMQMDQMQRFGGSTTSTTVIAQVLVRCEEIFSVRDIPTGALLQGDGDGGMRPVSHLVQLEIVTSYNHTTSEFRKGNWVITDWDNLLDGNVWFMSD